MNLERVLGVLVMSCGIMMFTFGPGDGPMRTRAFDAIIASAVGYILFTMGERL